MDEKTFNCRVSTTPFTKSKVLYCCIYTLVCCCLGGVVSLLKKKVYRGRLSYVVAKGTDKEPERVAYEREVSPGDDADDTSSSSSAEKKAGSESPMNGHATASASEVPESTDAGSEIPPTSSAPPTDLLVPFDQPLPPDVWTSREENYLSWNAYMITHLTSDHFCDRDFSMGTGLLRLIWVDGCITRKGAFDMFAKAEKGRHTELDEVCRIDVKAFRLEPLTHPGILTVDGERVSYGSIQAQVHPKLARVMSRKRRT